MKLLGNVFVGVFIATICFRSAVGQTNAIAEKANPKILEAWGWLLARNEKVAGVEISSNELAIFLKGFVAGSENQPLAYKSLIFSDVERLEKNRREKVTRAIIQKNAARADAFVAALKRNANVIALGDNVFYEPLRNGVGASPKPAQTVTVHYTARLLDGAEFYQAGPVDLVLVTNRSLCRGWIPALEKLKKGGSARLYVPPPLPEDEAERWGIEPGAMMIFEVDLLGFRDTSSEDLANAMIPPPPDSPPGKSGYDTAQVMEAWGWDTARRSRLNQYRLNTDEIALVAQGLAAAMKAEKTPEDVEAMYPQVGQFVRRRRDEARMDALRKRRAEMETLFASLRGNTNVVELPDGLRYEILKRGTGVFPKTGQTVLVNYVGHLIDGSIFDKTMGEPLQVKIGSVISGWNEGIQKVRKGGKIRLYIPPSLGYGNEAVSGIPSGSTLIFEIELVDVLSK
ncbi:MAG TPA: FKBP-type peptidyl-prolyl cis-trans isomerase [Candidatus Angelobacter sp.]|nr:FKBP-type peptidyl-prolyl cis-trans isomerase [Candidatus Angelobacter sp.]